MQPPESDVIDQYKHLLQPLRDITANWQLNIQEHLDDYLEKLRLTRERNMTNQNGEVVKFNFAEAAALVQGSLRIYAQKVDYLYDMISNACIGISNNKPKKKKNANTQREEEAGGLSGRLNTDFDFIDCKEKLVGEMVDLKWFMENDYKKVTKLPVRVGQRRDAGRRDRFVDLPISFIPTKKAAPSQHHFQFEHNNEQIFVPQSDLCSYSAIAFSDSEARDLSVFMNTAYLKLVHSFSREFIPYLRDEYNQRLRRLVAPYSFEAPIETYEQILEIDRIVQLKDKADNSEVDDEKEGAIDLPNFEDFEQDLRQMPIEERTFVNQNGRFFESNHLEAMQSMQNGVAETTVGGEGLADDMTLNNREYNLRNSTINTTSAAEPELNIDDELAYLDEYADVRVRLRKNPNEKEKDKKKPKKHFKASILCELRDKRLQQKFEEMGEQYDKSKRKLSEYIDAKLFWRPLCNIGSAFENLNPLLREKHIQALNRVFYAQEKYEKAVNAKRKKEQQEAKLLMHKAERRKRREEDQLRRLDAKRRRLTLQDKRATSDKDDASQVNGANNEVQLYEPMFESNGNDCEDVENNDYFGAQPDEDDFVPLASNMADDIEEQYNPTALMEKEINEMINEQHMPDNEMDEELPKEINIFTKDCEQFTDEPQTQDVTVWGDNAATMMNDFQDSFELGTFGTNDPSFFDLDKLATLFTTSNFDLITDDQILLHSIQNFWTTSNEKANVGIKARLQQWSSHILARVDEDTRHKPFEIHQYGTAVLDAFGENGIGHIIKFRHIVKGVPKYEVSRYMLATLILANCGNVQIINKEDENKDATTNKRAGREGEEDEYCEKVDILQKNINKHTSLKLLSLQRHHEVFESEQLLITS
ncbi:CNDH2-C domain-containing protein [Aphelenchoides bicaudatus]|nr:CNDH2-C domain-containing protein [Aphelenchoides bicaudatus]